MTKYQVQELAAHRWFTVRTFDTKEAADSFAAWLGYKTRVKETT